MQFWEGIKTALCWYLCVICRPMEINFFHNLWWKSHLFAIFRQILIFLNIFDVWIFRLITNFSEISEPNALNFWNIWNRIVLEFINWSRKNNVKVVDRFWGKKIKNKNCEICHKFTKWKFSEKSEVFLAGVSCLWYSVGQNFKDFEHESRCPALKIKPRHTK